MVARSSPAPGATGISSILINIRLGYLAVKLRPRITTYFKQVSMPVGVPKESTIEGILSD